MSSIDAVCGLRFTDIGLSIDGVAAYGRRRLIKAGLGLALGPNTTAGVSYSGQFGGDVHDNARQRPVRLLVLE